MNCYNCHVKMEVIKDQPYQYKSCGLDNVEIFGMPQYKCPNCCEFYVSIPKIKQLHQVIAMNLCCQEERLSGAEIKYLRKEMRLKAIDFAKVLSIDPATLSRFENDHEAPSVPLDKFIRTTYLGVLLNELAESVEINILDLLSTAAKLPANPAKKIQLNPVEWLNKIIPSNCGEACALALVNSTT